MPKIVIGECELLKWTADFSRVAFFNSISHFSVSPSTFLFNKNNICSKGRFNVQCFFQTRNRDAAVSVTRLAEILPIWQKNTSLWQFSAVYFSFGKMMGLLWQIWNIISLFFVVANGQISKNNVTIWSHWLPLRWAY